MKNMRTWEHGVLKQNLTDFEENSENPKGFGKISEGLVKCQRVWSIKMSGYGHHYSIINQTFIKISGFGQKI